MFVRARTFLKQGPRHVLRRLLAGKAHCFPLVRERLHGRGIEIGGPSAIFKSALPVYRLVCVENYTFPMHDASKLDRDDASCDFVLSSHMLEHSANPLRVLCEWRRVLKPGGHLLLVLPEGSLTFDHLRPITTMEHLLSDFENNVGEDDRTHIGESIRLVDRQHWSFLADWDEWKALCERNAENRQLHHHVFDERLSIEIVSYCGFKVLASEMSYPYHIIIFASKS